MTLARDPVEHKRYAEDIEGKLRGRPLLLDNPESKRLVKKRRIKCETNILKSATRRAADSGVLEGLTYQTLLPLHRLWEGYMKDVLGATQYTDFRTPLILDRRANLENALVRADYHGAFLRVVQSKCPSLVGKCGLVVQETLNTFVMMQADNRPATIPKGGCVFSCRISQPAGKDDEWLLFGDQLRQISGLRSSKKFKPKPSVSL